MIRVDARPMQQLEVQAACAGQGDYAALAQPISGISEIQSLQTMLAQMADQLRRYQRSWQSHAADVIRGQADERTRLARELHFRVHLPTNDPQQADKTLQVLSNWK